MTNQTYNCKVMVKLMKQIDVANTRFPIVNPLPPRFAMQYFAMQEELIQVKRKLAELEGTDNGEKVIVIRDITREEATKEIRELFSSGRTLYYSDIVQELGIDLEMVVDICNELQKDEEIAVDANVS